MAILHTPRPNKRGELEFVAKLEGLLGNGAHLWAELNAHTLGSGNECDLLLADLQTGVFAVEVKAIILDQIEEMGSQACRIAYPDGVQTKHPLDQARGGMNSLRNFLLKRAEGSAERYPIPFMSHCVAFPKISAKEFGDAFSSSRQLMDQAATFFIFSDDLDSTESLFEKLRAIRGRRPKAVGRQLDFLVEHLSVDAVVVRRPRSSTADAARAQVAIERIAAASARARAKPTAANVETPRERAFLAETDPKVAIFQGAPGTGKTLELMSLALEHAKAGRRVLFTCFNLVLASYLEGLLAHKDIDDSLAAEIDVMPVGRLLQLVEHDQELIARNYDTVCIDEAQDFSARGFDDIQLVAKPDARWFLADGPGQELFGDAAAPLLVRAREKAEELGSLFKLQTSKRAASASLQIARSVRDLAPNGDRLSAWYSTRAVQRRPAQEALALDVEAVPDPSELIDIRYWSHPPGKEECFQEVLTDLLAKLERERRPFDLAVLVSRTKREALNLATARKALERMGVPYLDQTVDANKSVVLPEGHVRLVSYSSARGIEASRVLLLDMGQAFWRPKTKREAEVSRTMLYVALTRGRLGTTVLSAPADRTGAYLQFLQASVDEYERLMDAAADS